MKNMSRLTQYVAFAVVAASMVATSFAQQLSQSTAKIVRIKGSARYADTSNVWKPLKVGDVLKAGTLIQTAADSQVDIVLGEKDATGNQLKWGETSSYVGAGGGDSHSQRDFIRISQNSVLAFERLLIADTGTDKIREIELDLRSGEVFGTVKKLNRGSRYEVKVPNAVAGIRGTVYKITAGGQVLVLSGAVEVGYRDADGNIVTQTVNQGQTFDASTGQVNTLSPSDRSTMASIVRTSETYPNTSTTFSYNGNEYWVSPTTGSKP
jgi:hypothetical protein